jgi:hypothetical protein
VRLRDVVLLDQASACWHLTIVGGVRERWVVTRRRRGRQYAPAALDQALLGGPSTSPLGATMALRLTMCFILWAATASWAQMGAPAQVPTNCEAREVGPVLFFAPSEIRAATPLFAPKEDPASTPSTVTEGVYDRGFDGPTLHLLVQYGHVGEDQVGPSQNFRSHYESIDGKRARMESFTAPTNGVLRWENYRVVYFADIGKANMRLRVIASCDGQTGCQEAENIFRTIRFK